MNNSLNALGRAGLYLTVFLTGAAVMIIELLGTRMIAPFYGVSLYVWSSLISVALMALSLGYFVGGKWADRTKRTGLSLIIAFSAILTLLIPLLTRPILLATDPLGLRAGAFVSALALFFPSLTLLGMVSPFAIKLLTSRLEGVGSSAGSIYAVGTIGSVVGTLLLGFFLFPRVGSREILVGVGITLLVLAVMVAFYEQRQLTMSVAVVARSFLLLIAGILLTQAIELGSSKALDKSYKILSERESLYGWVRVIDQPEQDLRVLTSDASIVGAASISNGNSRLSYQEIVKLIPGLMPNMTRGLIIGLGAGHMSSTLHSRYGIVTDTLEIDPAVASAASRYFSFTPTGKPIVGDARYEIRHLKGPYDLIIHDCFTGGTEPAHLLTVETLTRLRELMSDQGVLAINFVSFLQQGNNLALASVGRTIAQVFPHHAVFISEPGVDFNDFIFLASKEAINLNSNTLDIKQSVWLKKRLLTLDNSKGTILTDNLNPLEHLQVRKAEHYRQVVAGWFESDLLIR